MNRDDDSKPDPRPPHDAAPGDDYLWDKSGAPDAEIVALEHALGGARWQGGRGASAGREPTGARVRRRLLLACAAGVLVAALGVSIAGLWSAAQPGTDARGGPLAESGPGATAGSDTAGDAGAGAFTAEALSGSIAVSELRVGDRLQTDGATRARLTIGALGSVLVEPDSRVRVEAAAGGDLAAANDSGRERKDGRAGVAAAGVAAAGVAAGGVAAGGVPNRLYLEQGALTASIFAAPRLFAVGTPSGLAVDLGCVYTARVEDDGSTLLSVVLGQVSFETEGRQVTVPSGASAHASPGSGPGTPVWDDAPDAYRAAVARLDGAVATAAASRDDVARALDAVLATDRAEDSLTLWHLLAWGAVAAPERERVLVTLASLAPPPDGVDRQACLDGDAATLRRWRESFTWSW